jgi:cytochrome c oxidase subunit II
LKTAQLSRRFSSLRQPRQKTFIASMSLSYFSGPRLRRLFSAIGLACIALLLAGWIGGPQSTFDTKGPVAKTQLDVFYVTLWVSVIIFVLVAAVLAYATIKFKARSEADEYAEPPAQGHGNPLVELGLIGASVIALVFIAVPTLRAIWFVYDVPEELRDQAYEVNAIGHQWWFNFQYPSEQIEGVGQLVTANELVIPAGRPVRVNLRTNDVIHSFWVPKLAGKVDMIPNRGNKLWLQADEPGYFWGQCAEFCGESHAVMRFRVIALAEDDFRAWVENQKSTARTVTPTIAAVAAAAELPRAQLASYSFKRNQKGWTHEFDADPMDHWVQQQFPAKGEDGVLIGRGRELFKAKSCITCHAVRGHEGVGVVGPDLTHIGSRTTIAAGLLENNEENMIRWLSEPNEVKPGNLMYFGRAMPGYKVRNQDTDEWETNFEVSQEEARALTAYLNSLK